MQDEEVLLYKLYNLFSEDSQPKMPELMFIQGKVNNLDRVLKTLQALTKTISFYPPPQYKNFQQNSKQNKQYWKETTAEFIK